MTRVYIACPATDYHSTDLMRAIVASQTKFDTNDVFIPDPVRQIFLGNRQGVDVFVFLTLPDGRISFGVGRELKLAFARELQVWQYNRQTQQLEQVSKQPRGILTREETAEIERQLINASKGL